MREIKKVAVIGAGVMGAGIAAQVANAGVPVVLLDIVPDGAADRSVIAKTAIEKLIKADPAPLMSKRNAKLITPGNIEDDLGLLADCDWIIEAVIERLDIKQALYAKLQGVRKTGSVVSSNTSTIPLAKLVEGQPEQFAADFLITHFFNPPRYMRLLEVVASPQTSADAVAAIEAFSDVSLGKSIVCCNDRPGFIGNRLGIYWLQVAVVKAMEHGVTIEEADAIIGKPFGIPKTGVFGLLDLVGLDLMPHINASMAANLPPDDPFHAINKPLPVVEKMIAEGYTGRKGKGGFYRLNRTGGAKVKESIDLASGEYRESRKPDISALAAARKDLSKLFTVDARLGRYALEVMGATLSYAAGLVGDAADSADKIDEAMRLGYNWKFGPFELIDKLGADWVVAAFKNAGLPVAPILEQARGRTIYRVENGVRQVLGLDGNYTDLVRPEGVVMLSDIKLKSQPIVKNASAALWDVGDGVACFEFTSKMNSIDSSTFELLGKSLAIVARQFKALVLYNEGSHFSAGANLGMASFAMNIAAWPLIEELVGGGQKMMKAMRDAPFPVVGAPSGMALGGGCEFLLHCDAVQAHAETYMGLVEVGVGLIPGWGGCKEMLARWSEPGKLPNGPMPAAGKAFELISTATVSKSANEAKDHGYMRKGDGITMNRYRLLADAKKKALSLVEGYQPRETPTYRLPGPTGKAAMMMAVTGFHKVGKATDYDLVVANALANVLSGGDTDFIEEMSEDDVLALERENFYQLVREKGTAARIAHMLETGKPLRN